MSLHRSPRNHSRTEKRVSPMSTHKPIPEGITAAHVHSALHDIDSGVEHPFREPTRWLLINEGSAYPPKAAIGLAAKYAFGAILAPSEFASGEEPRQAVGYL